MTIPAEVIAELEAWIDRARESGGELALKIHVPPPGRHGARPEYRIVPPEMRVTPRE